ARRRTGPAPHPRPRVQHRAPARRPRRHRRRGPRQRVRDRPRLPLPVRRPRPVRGRFDRQRVRGDRPVLRRAPAARRAAAHHRLPLRRPRHPLLADRLRPRLGGAHPQPGRGGHRHRLTPPAPPTPRKAPPCPTASRTRRRRPPSSPRAPPPRRSWATACAAPTWRAPRAPRPPPSLTFVSEAAGAAQIEGHREDCLDLVRRAYLTHDVGDSVNPQSGFLRFPDQPRARIISLPAYLGGEFGVAGLKWIASFPDNPRTHGIPRASAVLLLNDVVTGYPAACLESSVISATRTAASAVLAAETLSGGRAARRVGVVGTGLIARHVWKFLRDLKWDIGGFTLHDLNPEAAHAF